MKRGCTKNVEKKKHFKRKKIYILLECVRFPFRLSEKTERGKTEETRQRILFISTN